ncbi:MAG TPA: hypothetical protein VE912_01660 [Bacteroidales bacterium]|nr:hypothetical protein [Bacteroidales bacterium]
MHRLLKKRSFLIYLFALSCLLGTGCSAGKKTVRIINCTDSSTYPYTKVGFKNEKKIHKLLEHHRKELARERH